MLYRSKIEKRLKYKQKILEDLRKRFRTEYLGQLLLRNKKKKETRKIEIDDVVLVGDDTQTHRLTIGTRSKNNSGPRWSR